MHYEHITHGATEGLRKRIEDYEREAVVIRESQDPSMHLLLCAIRKNVKALEVRLSTIGRQVHLAQDTEYVEMLFRKTHEKLVGLRQTVYVRSMISRNLENVLAAEKKAKSARAELLALVATEQP